MSVQVLAPGQAECLLKNGEFFPRETLILNEVDTLRNELFGAQQELYKIPVSTIIALLNQFSRKIIQSVEVNGIDGAAFLSNWLRKSNLEKVLKTNFSNPEVLNQFVGTGNKRVKVQPRGLICHWIAGNVPTLGLFSLFQSMLARNANVLRIPAQSLDPTLALLKVFGETEYNGITGKDLLKAVSVLYFPSSDHSMNNKMSLIADARVVWGGKEAVQSIQGLDHREHCEDIIFGPKYSFAVLDKIAQEKSDLEKIVRRFTADIIAFEQSACSSPHVFFIEGPTSLADIHVIAELFAKEFERMSKVQPKRTISQRTATQIISKRAEYALSTEKDVLCSKTNDWTILLDTNVCLEDPIQSRTIWIKPVNSVLDVIPLITRKVQTIGCAIADTKTFQEFVDQATLHGVARCVAPGQMNIYDAPWDGLLLLQRLTLSVTAIKM